jgi:hypothetical protein
MKTKEEIKRLAQEWFLNDKSLAYGEEFGFIQGYTQCQEDIKPLLKDLFSLWESLAEVGEINIGQNFIKKYEELKQQLNKQDNETNN